MDTWTIKPLDLATLKMTAGAQVYKHGVKQNVGEVIDTPCIALLLINDRTGKKIMVDAGPADDTVWGSKYHNPISRSEEQMLENALKKYDTTVDEIEMVILTHLHWDHGYGVLKLPNARVIVQKEEIRYAVCPLPLDKKHYELNIKEKMPFFLEFFNRIETVNGDVAVEDGIKVVVLPGHSPGSQGVVINTEKGKYMIAGDLINAVENWEKRLPGGLYGNMEDCYMSFDKIEEQGAIMIPSHDYAAFKILA